MSRNLGIKASNNGDFFFVSYSSDDEKRVSEYVQLLYEHGVTLWYDNGIRKSQLWEKELADNLQNCKAVLMFISKSILAKEDSFVRTEFNIAKIDFDKEVYIVHLDEIKPSDVPNRYKFWWKSICDLQSFEAFRHKTVSSCVYEILDALDINRDKKQESDYEADFRSFIEEINQKPLRLSLNNGTEYNYEDSENLHVCGNVSHALWLIMPQYMSKAGLVFADIHHRKLNAEITKRELFRLTVLSKQILSENGLIILKTDIGGFVDCKSFCDEIIGAHNLVGVITLERRSRSVSRIGLNNDFLLIYSPNTHVMRRLEDYASEDPDANGIKSNWNDPKYSSAKCLIKDIIKIFLPKDGLLVELYNTSDVHAMAVNELNKADGGERKYILLGDGDNAKENNLDCKRLKIEEA